jgi:signal transduction histidine kinase/CheY-like chemotaxis protein
MSVSLWSITDEAYLVVSGLGIVVDANPALCALLKRDRIDLLGRDIGDIFVMTDSALDSISGAGQIGGSARLSTAAELSCITLSGRRLELNLRRVAAQGRSGSHMCFRVVESFSKSAKPRRNLFQRLRSRVVGRRQPDCASAEAQDFAPVSSGILASIGHELRTPLSAIQGALRLLLPMLDVKRNTDEVAQVQDGVKAAAVLSNQAQVLTEMALRNADRLSQLILDLTDPPSNLSHLSGVGWLLCDVSKIVLEDVIHGTVDSIETLLVEKCIKLSLEVPSNATFVQGDFKRLVQLLSNLVTNAIHHSPHGGEIVISLGVIGDVAQVRVRDQGSGVPAAIAGKILARTLGQSLSETNKSVRTGLGLAICKVILQQHGGKLGFRNLPGSGVEFFFDIPIVAEELESPISVRQSPTSATVLVVEDDFDSAAVLGAMIRGLGFECKIAATIASAKEFLNGHRVDAVTLDLVMPDSHGTFLIEWMRRDPMLRHVPVIVVSGYAQPRKQETLGVDVAATGGDNVVAWMDKPVKQAAFVSFLNEALSLRAQRTVLYVGPKALRAAAFLQGVASRLATVIQIEDVSGALDFLEHHRCDTVVVVDPDVGMTRRLQFALGGTRQRALLINWFVQSPLQRVSAAAIPTGEIQSQNVVSLPLPSVTVVDISGTQWGAASLFQQWLGHSRAGAA